MLQKICLGWLAIVLVVSLAAFESPAEAQPLRNLLNRTVSFDGSLRRHLRRDHNVNTFGMTRAQLEARHAEIHGWNDTRRAASFGCSGGMVSTTSWQPTTVWQAVTTNWQPVTVREVQFETVEVAEPVVVMQTKTVRRPVVAERTAFRPVSTNFGTVVAPVAAAIRCEDCRPVARMSFPAGVVCENGVCYQAPAGAAAVPVVASSSRCFGL